MIHFFYKIYFIFFRRTKVLGRLWNRWIPMKLRTTIKLSKNQWVGNIIIDETGFFQALIGLTLCCALQLYETITQYSIILWLDLFLNMDLLSETRLNHFEKNFYCLLWKITFNSWLKLLRLPTLKRIRMLLNSMAILSALNREISSNFLLSSLLLNNPLSFSAF